MMYPEPTGPDADRTLETSGLAPGAEGASVKHAKLSGKRTKITAIVVYVFLTERVLRSVNFVVYKWKESQLTCR